MQKRFWLKKNLLTVRQTEGQRDRVIAAEGGGGGIARARERERR
jgi:hypothetical protein